jgi:hypothetical protein
MIGQFRFVRPIIGRFMMLGMKKLGGPNMTMIH